jgi:hypothetical protein
MIKVPVKTKNGVYRVMRIRVPRTRTFALYRTAEEGAPDLLKQIYAVISRVVEADATETVHRSTVLIKRIPSNWPFRDRWLKFLDSDSARRSLFEQVLWTYFFDREETWETTWPDKDRTDAKYARKTPMPPVAKAPRLSRGSATVAPKSSRRGIAPRSSAPAAASRGLAPVARAPDETLKRGDTVEIVDHPFAGRTGVVADVVDDDGFELVTVRMQVAGLWKDISGFLPSQVRKI